MAWAKSRDGVSNLWMKPMIHYDKLVEIYATDLAKGFKVKSPGDLLDRDEDKFNVVSSQTVDESGPQSQANTTRNSTRESLKRKACDDPIEKECIQISKSVSCFSAMNATRNAFVRDVDVDVNEENNNRRKHLFQVIVALPRLNQEEVVMATRLIGLDPAKLDLFYSMPDTYKVIFAQQEIAQSKSK
ncbi:hypothetical protein M5689_001190 [Euphorbia peplus]|nr:hypothetical protein M5689_001190 [Euphorbia peplus]